MRCAAPLLTAASLALVPSRELAPADVLHVQLEALQANDLERVYQFASPANRRNIGSSSSLELMVKRTPAYCPLVSHSSCEVLSALSLGDRWTARVRVRPSDAWRAALPHSASPVVGDRVQLAADPAHVRRALETVDYQWSDLMAGMAGAELEVLCESRPNRGTNIVGLPSPDGSQGGVWYFPVTALARPEGAAAAPEAHEFRWDLSRQADVAVAHGLGQVILHRRYGYRGVIVGFDPCCLQDDAWCEQMGVDALAQGRQQPFYHVLVDRRDREGEQVTYVAQENVLRPDAEAQPVEHSYVGAMLRPDTFDALRGEYEPTDELRDLYPQRVEGCWMVDAVTPDAPADEASSL